VDITITEAGLQLLEQVNPSVDKLTSEIINLNEEDARTLNHLLDKLREGIENKDYSNLHTNIERSNS
jgi:ATP phosphoribosyltransferase